VPCILYVVLLALHKLNDPRSNNAFVLVVHSATFGAWIRSESSSDGCFEICCSKPEAAADRARSAALLAAAAIAELSTSLGTSKKLFRDSITSGRAVTRHGATSAENLLSALLSCGLLTKPSDKARASLLWSSCLPFHTTLSLLLFTMYESTDTVKADVLG